MGKEQSQQTNKETKGRKEKRKKKRDKDIQCYNKGAGGQESKGMFGLGSDIIENS